jgi:NAD(P)-dependent dehydrogenase (short-subunit alcohol dehydrogenase family)
VTGGYAGVGFELCKILYARNATIWIAGRSESKAQKAISDIQKASPASNGHLDFVCLDLSDLSTIKPAISDFVAQQPRLDVLVNNAGVDYLSHFSCALHAHQRLQSFLKQVQVM